jgi:hypothetical protein
MIEERKEKRTENRDDKEAVPFFARYLENQHAQTESSKAEAGRPRTMKHPTDKEDSFE